MLDIGSPEGRAMQGCIFFYNSPPPRGGKESKALRAREENQRRVKKKGRRKGKGRGKGRKGRKGKENKRTNLLLKEEKI